MLLPRTAVLFCHVDEFSRRNSPPRKAAQLVGVPAPSHPSLTTTSVCQLEDDIKTFRVWSGVPTEMLKEEKGPSFPSTVQPHQFTISSFDVKWLDIQV